MNPKIANIAKPGVAARSDVIVIADSDICVGRDRLRALASPLESAKVGAVACLCSGNPNDAIVSRLGAIGIDARNGFEIARNGYLFSISRLWAAAGDHVSRGHVLLIPLRDFLSLGVWAASLFGRRRSFR